ncbi:MAG: trimeric intracellular cation channel family protein [Haliangiales bacterium]
MPALLDQGPLVWLDYLGIAVFAVSGALVAAEKRQNLVTFVFFAAATGMGGGTLRDLFIGAPVFWVGHNMSLLVCLGAALGVWFVARAPTAPKALLWFDAIGLAAYAVYGTEKALRYGIAPVPASAMGVMTACAGGIVRDVLAGQPSILLRPEVYVTAAALSATLYTAFTQFEVQPIVAAVIASLLGFALRGAAISRGLGLPGFRAGPKDAGE